MQDERIPTWDEIDRIVASALHRPASTNPQESQVLSRLSECGLTKRGATLALSWLRDGFDPTTAASEGVRCPGGVDPQKTPRVVAERAQAILAQFATPGARPTAVHAPDLGSRPSATLTTLTAPQRQRVADLKEQIAREYRRRGFGESSDRMAESTVREAERASVQEGGSADDLIGWVESALRHASQPSSPASRGGAR